MLPLDQLTREEKFLLHGVGRFVGQALGGAGTVAVPAGLDWPAVAHLAAFHRVTPLLDAVLPSNSWPTSIAPDVRSRLRQRRIRVTVMSEAFARLHVALRDAGVRTVPIKGLALAYHVYPSPAQRYFDDIDLLVPREGLVPAAAALETEGYRVHPNAAHPEWHHLAPHVHPQHGAVVEIHHDLLRRAGGGWSVAEIWQRVKPARVAGVDTEILDELDALLHTLLHGRHNLFHRLSTFVDALLLLGCLERQGRLGDVGPRAAEAEALASLAFLREQAGTFFPREAALQALLHDERLPATTGRYRTGRRLVAWRSLQPGTRPAHDGPLARLRELWLLDSPGAAARLGRALLFPPAAFVSESYGGGGPGGYARRLWRRARVAARQLRPPRT